MNIQRFWRSWGIAARLLAVAVLPAMLMFVVVMATMYFHAQADVRRDVADRGRLIATALAQSSQYALVSGNVIYLQSTLHNLVQGDASIACIDIANETRHSLAKECRDIVPADVSTVEVPVRIENMTDVDLFEPVAPTADAGGEGAPRRKAGGEALRTIGFVRVTMSPAPIFEAKRQAVAASSGLVLVAAVLGCLLGLRLVGRLRRTMIAVMSALRSIRMGEFDVRLDGGTRGELGELQHTILQMADNLRAARQHLEEQVAARTRELQTAVDLVRQADADKRRLIKRSNALVEEERRRIALDLHDQLGAALTSVRLEAAALASQAEAAHHDDMIGGARRIAATAESLYASTRHIVKRLRPEVLDTLGLAGAIEELVRHADEVSPICRFQFETEGRLPHLRGDIVMPAYRVAQEAINNIIKHADATQASVHLSLDGEGSHLCLLVKDDGKGFDTRARDGAGIGLIGMRERVAAVGGEVHIASRPGKGTIVRVSLPL